MKFGVLLFDGCEELDVFGPYEALCLARDLGAGFEVGLGMADPKPELTMAFGTRLRAEPLEPRAGDWVIVPGGGWLSRAPQGAWAEVQRGELPRRLAAWKAAGVSLASVCTGSLLLAAAGLLAGRAATTNHLAREELAGLGVDCRDAKVVDDGDIVTAAGLSSGLDLGIWLAERFAGAELAGALRLALEYPHPTTLVRGPNFR